MLLLGQPGFLYISVYQFKHQLALTMEKLKYEEIEGDGELSDEEHSAAVTLSDIKYKKLDETTSATLNKLKRKFHVTNSINYEEDPADFPPIPSLAGLIGKCSKSFEKQLTATDLDDHQMRLPLNWNHVEEFMLPILMLEAGEDVKEGFEVTTYDWEGNQYSMKFKAWKKMYVLTTKEWKRFYTKHQLKKEIDFVRVWMFRHRQTHNICFAITRRRSYTMKSQCSSTRVQIQ